MEKLIKKLKENDYRVFKIVEREQIEIVDADDFNQAQEGYRFNPLKNEPIDDWNTLVGEKYYVIGFDKDLGDPIIADAGTEGFPIYSMMHDDWESLEKIANSFDEFINNLKSIENIINTPNQDRSTIRKFVRKLDKENNTNDFYKLICSAILEKWGFYYQDFKAYKTQQSK